jgi:hypothetical protein
MNRTDQLLAPPVDNMSLQTACQAEFVRFESLSDFDRRSDMELVASTVEVEAMLAQSKRQDYLTFVSVMTNTTHQTPRTPLLPYTLTTTGPNTSVSLILPANGTRVVQVAIFAASTALENISVTFSDVGKLSAASSARLASPAFRPPALTIYTGQSCRLQWQWRRVRWAIF